MMLTWTYIHQTCLQEFRYEKVKRWKDTFNSLCSKPRKNGLKKVEKRNMRNIQNENMKDISRWRLNKRYENMTKWRRFSLEMFKVIWRCSAFRPMLLTSQTIGRAKHEYFKQIQSFFQ